VEEVPVRPGFRSLPAARQYNLARDELDYIRSTGWHDREYGQWLAYLRHYGQKSLKLTVKYPHHPYGEIRPKPTAGR